MTTIATKPVRRQTASTVFSSGARRPVIVSIYPDGLIGLRLHKHRREEFICADVAYKNAVVDRQRYERDVKRKAKKGAKK